MDVDIEKGIKMIIKYLFPVLVIGYIVRFLFTRILKNRDESFWTIFILCPILGLYILALGGILRQLVQEVFGLAFGFIPIFLVFSTIGVIAELVAYLGREREIRAEEKDWEQDYYGCKTPHKRKQ